MKANLELYRTLIDPNNTIAFMDKDDREQYFAYHKDKIVLSDCSFNGKRNIRINGYYEDLIVNKYNYCRIQTSKNVIYCFIDNYVYVNDNCSEIYVTIDYLTTYMPIIGKNSIQSRRNVRRHVGKFNEILGTPEMMYSNTFPVSYKKQDYRYSLSFNKNKLMYILVHFRSRDTGASITIGGTSETKLNGFCTAVFPFDVLEGVNKNYYIITNYNPSAVSDGVTGDFTTFVENFANDIIQISLVDYININTLKVATSITSVMGSTEYYMLLNRNLIWNEEIIIPSKYIDNKFNSKYYNLKLGRLDKYSILDPNELDIQPTINTSDRKIKIVVQMSAAAPFNYMVRVVGKTDTQIITIDPLSISLPYTISEWQQFYANNSASVNDGLTTQHKYATEIAERNLETERGKATVSGITGAISSIGNIATAVFNPLGAIFGMNRLMDTASNVANSLMGAEAAYNNTISNMQLEKELLEISYQNIKSAPDKVVFSQSDFGLIGVKTGVNFIIEEATNIDDIRKYHLMYGYEYKEILKEDKTLFDLLNYVDELVDIRLHNYVQFDNIRFTQTYPMYIKNPIINILKRGVHLWSRNATIGEYNE